MAKKKLSVEPKTHQDHHPLKSSKDPSPDHKLENLKTLNQLLVKETMEKRFQIDNLKSEVEELNQEQPFLFGLEREISRLVISSGVAEEIAKVGFLVKERDEIKMGMEDAISERDASHKVIGELESRVRALEAHNMGIRAQLEAAVAEREEVERKARKNEDASREEIGSKRKEIGDLESRVRVLEANNLGIRAQLESAMAEREEVKRKATKNEEVFESLREVMEVEREEMGKRHQEEMDSNAKKVSALEGELRNVVEAKGRFEADVGMMKVEIHRLNVEEKQLRSKFAELEKRDDKLKGENDGLREKVGVLEEEKETLARSLETGTRLSALELNEMRVKIGELEQESKELSAEFAELEKRNDKLKGENDGIWEKVGVLEEEKKVLARSLETQMRVSTLELNETRVKIEELEQEKKVLRLEFVELEKRNGELKGENDGIREKVGVLEEEKEVLARSLETQLRVSILELNETRVKIEELEREKKGLRSEIVVFEERIGELEGEVDVLEKEKEETEKSLKARIRESELKLTSLGENMALTEQAKDETEQEKADLEMVILESKKEVTKLNSTVLELRELSVKYTEENNRLQADREATRRALDIQIEELKSRDGTLEKLKELQISFDSLVSEKEEGKRNIELLERKMKAAEVTSEKALSLLKSTEEAMNGSEKAREISTAIDDDEDVRPFVGKLENIEKAYRKRVAKIDEMNRELDVMKFAVDDARKKRGLWMWLYPATTTVLAAISFAYAARMR